MPYAQFGVLMETPLDASGAIAVDATAQPLLTAVQPGDKDRRYFLFQNNSANPMWLNFGAVAVDAPPSIQIAAGTAYENPPHFCPAGAVSVWGTTAADAFTCKYF